MKISIRNQAGIPNKYIRFVKWKIRNIQSKFNELLYFEAYISKEGSSVPRYKTVLKLGVPGHDIILSHQSANLKELWSKSMQSVQRYLRKSKERQVATRSRLV